MLNDLVVEFMKRIHHAGVFKDRSSSSERKGFRLKLHDTNPDAPLSPFYIDYRLLRSFPDLLLLSGKVFEELMHYEDVWPDLLADIPTAITPSVTVLSLRTKVGMVTPRGESKGHGSGAEIDGVFKPSMTTILFDDVITKAGSKIAAYETMTRNGLKVLGVMVLTDRQQGGAQELSSRGINFWSAFTLSDMLEFYREEKLISTELFDEIQAYRKG